MKDVSATIQYKNKKYELVFNLNVMEAIQEEYGSVEQWGKMCEPPSPKGEPCIKALKYGFAAMLNEGIDISNEENGTNDPILSLKQVGRIVSGLGIKNAAVALNQAVVKSTEIDKKNGSSTKKK